MQVEVAATVEPKKPKVSKILVIHLKSTFRRLPMLEYEVYDIVFEDDLSYTLALGPNVHHASSQVVKKADVNEVRYVQVFSQVDGKTYWHFDVHVYAEVDDGSSVDEFLEFWSSEIKERAMRELKAQNQMLKEMYKGIEALT